MSALDRLHLYWETARHLRPVQVYRRLWLHAVHPKPDLRPAPLLRRHEPEQWVPPAYRRQSQFGPDEFRFLNETRALARRGWDDPDASKLWRYNLHAFDDLTAEDARQRTPWHRALIARWIAENAAGSGTGWEAYPTSRRIVSWIKWARAGNSPAPQVIDSLAVQTRWLARRLEYHLLGNHLLANAKALVFSGCFFDGPEADGWRDLGMSLLARELPEQILADGGHFELSPMYHALVLEDMLDLVNITRSAGTPALRRWRAEIAGWPMRIEAMRRWLAAMCHPDGEIAFFNDAAIGVAPSPAQLEDYAARLGFAPVGHAGCGPRWLRDSGYVRLESGRAVALLDVARVGPDYLPGHAHADTLSFELSVDGRRVVVNSGTSVYGTGAERLRQRGTGAHNTVVIDGENSSEVWSGFRVARRARPEGLVVKEDERTVICGHDGYRQLAGRPRHRRTWTLRDDGLVIGDTVEGDHRCATAAFHFHPEVTPAAAADAASGTLAIASGPTLRWRIAKGQARLEPSTWHPEFGLSLPSSRLLVALTEGESRVELSWADA